MAFVRKISVKNYSYLRFLSTEPCKTDSVDTKKTLLKINSCDKDDGGEKVTIAGIGSVGMAVAFALVSQKISNHIVLLDSDQKKLRGEKLDLQYGSLFRGNSKIEACSDYTKTTCSKVCVITAGVRQKPEETRLNLVKRNADIIRAMVPKLVKYSPNTILLLVTNPVDIMTYVAWKFSGLPAERVFGSGTNLDSSRFRFFLSERFGVSPTQCHGYIIGEHGDSSVPLWSSVNVAGVRLRDLNPDAGSEEDSENWCEIHKKVIKAANEVIKLKGYTSWAVGFSVASIVNSILRKSLHFQPVSLNAKGFYCIDEDLFMSLPALINSNGISAILKKKIDCVEKEKLAESAKILLDTQTCMKI